MKITSVTYRRLVTTEQYANTTIGATAEVESEEPEDTLAGLREWVDGQLADATGLATEHESARESLTATRNQLYTLQRRLQDAQRKWEEVATILKANGVEPGQFVSRWDFDSPDYQDDEQGPF